MKRIPFNRVNQFIDLHERATDHIMLSKHVVLIRTSEDYLLHLDKDNQDKDAEVSWTLRRQRVHGESKEHLILKKMPEEFNEFQKKFMFQILESEKACGIIRETIDLITLSQVMSLPEILDSVFLRKIGIVVSKDIPMNTSFHLDIQDQEGPQ